MTTNLAVDVHARLLIINPIAVAHVEARLGTVPPDRVLDEPRKRLRKTRIELSGINPLGHGLYNVGAAASLVAGCTIRMIGLEPCQDACADQKVVHQGVDGNHAGANLMPEVQAFRGGQQDAGRAHGQDLVRNARDLPERSDQSFPQLGEPIGAGRVIGILELPVDPADQIAVGNIADEQEKRVGHLVEPTVAQLMGGSGQASM
jgi:hypothetical protein